MASVSWPAAINLSYWLHKVHPEIFRALLNQAQGRPSGLGALGDDGSDFFPGVSAMPDDSSIDVGNFIQSDAGSISTSDINASLSPDLVSLPSSQDTFGSGDFYTGITPMPGSSDFYTGITPMPAADTNVDIGNFLDNANAPSIAGGGDATVGTLNPPSASNVGSVAGLLTAGLGALTAITTAIYKSGSPQASTIGMQANRVATGVNPAPITYGYNSAGQLVPVLSSASTGTVSALSPQTLASLGVPSTWGPYILPVAIGVIVLVAVSGGSRK